MSADLIQIRERLCWYVRVCGNVQHQLYGPLRWVEFCRDHRRLVEGLLQFRSRCQGRGWVIPEADQERVIGKLIARCKEYLAKGAIERTYIPGYLGKALLRLVDEIADEAQKKWKRNELAGLPPEIMKALVETALARTVTDAITRASR